MPAIDPYETDPDVATKEIPFRNKSDLEIYAKRWTSKDANWKPSALVVFCHGIADYCHRNNHVFNALVKDRNAAVYALDLRGHGKSEEIGRAHV